MTMFQRYREKAVSAVLLGCGLLSIAVTVAIIVILAWESWAFFQEVSPFEFVLGTRWSPILEPRSFGVLPLVCGTFLVAAGALVVAVPIGLGAALYLSEYAPSKLRAVAKPVLEILAGVPTVVFGYFALTFITPYLLRPLIPQVEVFNALSGALVVGIMIVPTICSLCDDAFRAVPRSLREGSFALAATKMETSLRVVLPAAFSGVVASILLALGRAVGETMAVTLAAGMTPKLTLNPLVSIQTMTSYIVQVCFGDTPAGSTVYQTIFGVGMMLFLITLLINVIAQRVMRRFREAYD